MRERESGVHLIRSIHLLTQTSLFVGTIEKMALAEGEEK